MSIFELLVVFIVAILLIKPADIPHIAKNIRYIIKYIKSIQKDFFSYFEDMDETEEINKYLTKIIELDGEYKGDYDLVEIRKYYQKLKRHKESFREQEK